MILFQRDNGATQVMLSDKAITEIPAWFVG
jgi:hypothetical protein